MTTLEKYCNQEWIDYNSLNEEQKKKIMQTFGFAKFQLLEDWELFKKELKEKYDRVLRHNS